MFYEGSIRFWFLWVVRAYRRVLSGVSSRALRVYIRVLYGGF